MSKLSRVTQTVLVQSNTFNEKDLKNLNIENSPVSLLNKDFSKTTEISGIDLVLDEEIVCKYLLANSDDDYLCAVKLYQTFKRMDKLTTLDSRVWTYYSLIAFWPYTYKKYLENNKITHDLFSRKAILLNSNIEKILENSISKLWWVVHLTRQSELNEKYFLTEYVFKNPTMIDTFLLLPAMKNPKFTSNFFEAYKLIDDSEWEIKKEDEKFIKELYEYLKSISYFTAFDLYDVAELLATFEKFKKMM